MIGLVNSEGVPGLDFPDIRINTEATFAYLNEHGGYGGRPLELVSCASKGSPETSQSCAQEIAGSDVELVLLGLDLFPGYPTFEASGLPVIGLLPLLPGDYTADALFVTGGNATLAAGMAGVADEQFDAKSVGIISADNSGIERNRGVVDRVTRQDRASNTRRSRAATRRPTPASRA